MIHVASVLNNILTCLDKCIWQTTNIHSWCC